MRVWPPPTHLWGAGPAPGRGDARRARADLRAEAGWGAGAGQLRARRGPAGQAAAAVRCRRLIVDCSKHPHVFITSKWIKWKAAVVS